MRFLCPKPKATQANTSSFDTEHAASHHILGEISPCGCVPTTVTSDHKDLLSCLTRGNLDLPVRITPSISFGDAA
jgi:hypothetical protein